MTETGKEDCEALLEQAGWVRALSRHLTADVHSADDLSQEALAAALVRPAPSDMPLRSWLAAIVRNLARHQRRSAGARAARERAVAREEVDSSSAHLLERLDVHRAVVEAVARLDAPYRDAILMRYFEGLSPAAIAARTGTPLRTVHTRLHRALARLRTELDRAHGADGKTWLLALIPFARGSGGWSTVGVGAAVMDAKSKIALVVIAVVGVCSTLALWPSDPSEVSNASLAAAPSALEAETQHTPSSEPALEDSPAVVERRTRSVPATAAFSAPVPAPATPAKLSGRVIDVERVPVAGVKVRYSDPQHGPRDGFETTTDADGAFELEDLHGGGHLDIASAGWTNVLRPQFSAASGARELVLVVARSVTLAGTVVDDRGRAVQSADLAVPLPFGLRSRFDAILDSSTAIEHSTKSDADGRFELKDVPLVADVKLVTTHAIHLADERPLPAHDDLGLEIVLRPVRAQPAHWLGHVVDDEGNAVEGAWVGCGEKSTKSGPAGEFALELETSSDAGAAADGSDTTHLRAVKQGYLPAEVVHASGSTWPDPLTLRLGAPALSIEGRVVDVDGQPVAGAHVWTDEETRFGYIPIGSGEMSMHAVATVEGILRGDPWTRRAVTDASGHFALAGLLARDYRIHALDRTHLFAVTASLAAGVHNVELRMRGEPLHQRVAGRVTSLSGAPIAGIDVVLERKLAGIRSSEFERLESLRATTDAAGRFAFEKVSRAVHLVNLSGIDLETTGFHHPIGPDEDVGSLEIAVPMRVHVQIDAEVPAEFDEVAVLDARGEKLYVSVQHGESSYSMKEVAVQAGRTEPFTVSELGKTLVLYRNHLEVRRLPLELVRGELNTIRP